MMTRGAIRIHPFMTSCCGLGYLTLQGPRYKTCMAGFLWAEPGGSDPGVLLVMGSISKKLAPLLKSA